MLDNNLSKSKKEAVLLRRLTDRRRKPSKKFRHTQNDCNEYTNCNPFVEEFLDQTPNRLKKSISISLSNYSSLVDNMNNNNNNNNKQSTSAEDGSNNFENVKLNRRVSPPLHKANLSNDYKAQETMESDMKDEIEIKKFRICS